MTKQLPPKRPFTCPEQVTTTSPRWCVSSTNFISLCPTVAPSSVTIDIPLLAKSQRCQSESPYPRSGDPRLSTSSTSTPHFNVRSFNLPTFQRRAVHVLDADETLRIPLHPLYTLLLLCSLDILRRLASTKKTFDCAVD